MHAQLPRLSKLLIAGVICSPHRLKSEHPFTARVNLELFLLENYAICSRACCRNCTGATVLCGKDRDGASAYVTPCMLRMRERERRRAVFLFVVADARAKSGKRDVVAQLQLQSRAPTILTRT